MCFFKLLCSLGINFALIVTNRKTFTMYRGAVSARLLLGDCRSALLCGWGVGNNTLSGKGAATQWIQTLAWSRGEGRKDCFWVGTKILLYVAVQTRGYIST